MRRAGRARIWVRRLACQWLFATNDQRPYYAPIINSNRRLLALTRRALKDIDGIGDVRIKETETYREKLLGETRKSDGQEVRR